MKKNYNQPLVETAEVVTTSLMQQQAASPTGLPVSIPIPGEGGD